MLRSPARGVAALLAIAALGAAPAPGGSWLARLPSLGPMLGLGPLPIPAIVFVSRDPVPGNPRLVPGLGPTGRTVVTHGRLMLREANGKLRELLPSGALIDVADPAISFDGRRVAFAGMREHDSGWRIYEIGVDGKGLRAVTHTEAGVERPSRFARYDDFDPCWIGEHRICFASTRYPLTAQYANVPVSNLYVLDVPRQADALGIPRRITSERNGAEEPTLDPLRGEIVFARWWFNRFQAAASGLAVAAAEALPRDSVNLWEAVAIGADGFRLACGDLGSRRATMAYQPAFLADKTPIGVYALNLGLWPSSGPVGIQRFPDRIGPALRLAGAAIPDSARHSYGDAVGLAAPAACSPAGLPDGRVVFSYSPGARGDFGIYVVDRDGHFAPWVLVDLPGTLELDPAPVVTRPAPWLRGVPVESLGTSPALVGEAPRGTFTYHSLGVFRETRRVPGAPPQVRDARLRFYAAPLASADADGDSAILLRETPLAADGSIEARGLPADVPLFEQLVDERGKVLISAHGPAHVAGFNAGSPNSESRCLGCHFGHSAIPLPVPIPATKTR